MGKSEPFLYQTKLEFADTDSAGVAHFTSILKIVERAEHAFLESLEIPVIQHSRGRVGAPSFGWPRVDVRFRFRRPIVFADRLTVELSVTELGAKSITYYTRVLLADGEVAAEGKLVNACVGHGEDDRMEAMEIPLQIREILSGYLVTE